MLLDVQRAEGGVRVEDEDKGREVKIECQDIFFPHLAFGRTV